MSEKSLPISMKKAGQKADYFVKILTHSFLLTIGVAHSTHRCVKKVTLLLRILTIENIIVYINQPLSGNLLMSSKVLLVCQVS